MSAAGGGYTSRKFVTEELLTKLNTLLEQLARQQPPIDPTVDAYKRENDKLQYYLNELKKKPDDPYLQAQLHQAMDDKQQLYDLYEGNKNPFKTSTTTTSEVSQQVSQPVSQPVSQADKDMKAELEKIRELMESYRQEREKSRKKPKPERTSSFMGVNSPPPTYYSKKKPPQKEDKRTASYMTPHRKPVFRGPRRLVTDVIDWS